LEEGAGRTKRAGRTASRSIKKRGEKEKRNRNCPESLTHTGEEKQGTKRHMNGGGKEVGGWKGKNRKAS